MLILAITAYIIGAIPTGYWFGTYFFNIDITKHGSGNIGATNIARKLGTHYFFLVFAIDALKSAVFLIVCSDYFHVSISHLIFLSGMLLIGNAHSIFLKFQGGKGVATTVGILAALTPWWIATFFVLCWLLILVSTKRADIASLASIVLTAIYSYFSLHYINPSLLVLFGFITVWLFWTHRNNLKNSLPSKSL